MNHHNPLLSRPSHPLTATTKAKAFYYKPQDERELVCILNCLPYRGDTATGMAQSELRNRLLTSNINISMDGARTHLKHLKELDMVVSTPYDSSGRKVFLWTRTYRTNDIPAFLAGEISFEAMLQ